MTDDPSALLSSHPIDVVSFDVDGTLYDAGVHTLRVGLRLLPHRRIMGVWRRVVEKARTSRHEDLEAWIVDEVAFETGEAVPRVREVLGRCLGDVWVGALRPRHVRKGIREALELIDRRGIRRVVVSDHEAGPKLSALDLEGWTRVVSASALGALKPFPDSLLFVARELGVAPTSILHIGDRPETDGEAARLVGARFLRFPPEKPHLAERIAEMLDSWGSA